MDKHKYEKYKAKYMQLKRMRGGGKVLRYKCLTIEKEELGKRSVSKSSSGMCMQPPAEINVEGNTWNDIIRAINEQYNFGNPSKIIFIIGSRRLEISKEMFNQRINIDAVIDFDNIIIHV